MKKLLLMSLLSLVATSSMHAMQNQLPIPSLPSECWAMVFNNIPQPIVDKDAQSAFPNKTIYAVYLAHLNDQTKKFAEALCKFLYNNTENLQKVQNYLGIDSDKSISEIIKTIMQLVNEPIQVIVSRIENAQTSTSVFRETKRYLLQFLLFRANPEDCEFIKLVLYFKANTNKKSISDNMGDYPLFEAIEHIIMYPELITMLIKYGAYVKIKSFSNNRTLLRQLCRLASKKQLDIAREKNQCVVTDDQIVQLIDLMVKHGAREISLTWYSENTKLMNEAYSNALKKYENKRC